LIHPRITTTIYRPVDTLLVCSVTKKSDPVVTWVWETTNEHISCNNIPCDWNMQQ